ncbi:MAG: hypothetical protein ACI8ZM_003498 [Crocinitomix sp.]|jgi:hypothetical protein
MRLSLVLFLFTCCKLSFGQFIVQGTVQDNLGNPIINARVEINNKDQYCFSNNHGEFYYDALNPIKIVSVYYLGYKTTQQQFEPTVANDTLTVYFKLIEDGKTLDVININAVSETEIYTERDYAVIDFKLLSNSLLVLVKRQKDYYLKEFNQLNELIREQKVYFKPTKIVSDCFEQIHLQNDDHSYLLNRDNFHLSKAQKITDYNRNNAPCMAEFDSTLFISKRLDNNQSVIYMVMNKTTRKKTFLHTISDEESAYIAWYYNSRKVISEQLKITENMYHVYPGVYNPGQLNADIVLDLVEDADWYSQVLSNPTYHPLFKVNDSVYVFDHLESRCSVYDEKGRSFRSFQIKHHLSNTWGKRIIIDQAKSRAYALMRNSHYFLSEINLTNGKIKKAYNLDFNCALSPKFEIRNNFIYYIYKENKTSGFRKLYRQRLN